MRRLRIAFDATSLMGQRTGVGTVAAELLRRLARRDDLAMVAFAVSWRGRDELDRVAPAGVEVVRRPVPARVARQLWLRSRWPPVEWLAGACDVVHGPNFVVPPARHAASLVTVHDLTCVHHPERCTSDTRQYPRLLSRALDAGAVVHAVSEHVADDVRASFSLARDRVVTIANGVVPVPDVDGAIGRALAGADRYVVVLGTIEPRKDLPTAVGAFDRVADEDPELRLVIAGPDGWGAPALDDALARCAHRDRVVRVGWLEPDERAGLLRGASALVHTALDEGFGFTPLEAMSAGVPVVATAAGAVPEVVGDAALLAPVGDVDGVADRLSSVLRDRSLADRLAARGHERVSRYSWDDAAESLANLYHRLADR